MDDFDSRFNIFDYDFVNDEDKENRKELPIGFDTDRGEHIVNIKVLGAGGAGCNAIKRLITSNYPNNVKFIAVNLDAQSLNDVPAHIRIPVGKTRQGAGGMPTIGENAAREAEETFRSVLENTDMVILTAGMGGGTGTGVIPIIAEIAKGMGILTLAIVYTPFQFEGDKKLRAAHEGLGRLQENVDTLIVISNQKLIDKSNISIKIEDAFLLADNTLKDTVETISHIVNDVGQMNVDFQDLKAITQGKGSAIIGIGVASGEDKAQKALNQALNHPLMESYNIDDAEGIILYFIGSPQNLILKELTSVGDYIRDKAPKADLKWGFGFDHSMGDEIKVLLIISGFRWSNGDHHSIYTGMAKKSQSSDNRKNSMEPAPLNVAIDFTKPAEIAKNRHINDDMEDIDEYFFEDEASEKATVKNSVSLPTNIANNLKSRLNKPTSLIFSKGRFPHKKLD